MLMSSDYTAFKSVTRLRFHRTERGEISPGTTGRSHAPTTATVQRRKFEVKLAVDRLESLI